MRLGLCNANNALTRAVISDIVPRGPKRAQAYGYHGMRASRRVDKTEFNLTNKSGATVSFARAFSRYLYTYITKNHAHYLLLFAVH